VNADLPRTLWSVLFVIVLIAMVGLAGMHATAPKVQFSDQFAAGVLVPLCLLGIVIWGVAIRMLLVGRKKH
jgi:hypothetical protein